MSSPDEFSVQLQAAIKEKTDWFDSTELPELVENYRLLHVCVKNFFDTLSKRGIIIPDPYKLDKKISDIKSPENTPFSDTERAKILGQRFSDYESTLDYICTYYKFSTEHITLAETKKLIELNSCFLWDSLFTNSSKTNTRFMAAAINDARQQTTGITVSNINDAVNRSNQAMTRINHILREYITFKREEYKAIIREKVIASDKYNEAKASASPQAQVAEIKKLFQELVGKKSFYNDLVLEIANEDQASDKEARRAAVLAKLEPKTKNQASKKQKVDTKAMILEAVSVLVASAPQYEQVEQKLVENNQILHATKNTLIEKFKAFLRKTFGIAAKSIDYNVVVVDPQTQAKKNVKVDFNSFTETLHRRTQLYNALATPQSAEFSKIRSATEDTILAFVEKHISENQELLLLLAALDEFFKNNAAPENRPKIKGLKMELVSIKNCIVKTNQKRADYIAYIEEAAQLKKLGIADE